MLNVGATIDNRTVCDLFGVANMGGIRVCTARNHIVLISNNTDPLYRNEWKDDVLHFVGMGSTGPQKLDRQNRTLANTTKSGATIHLFEVFEKSRYVYAGEVELAGEPYRSDQQDTRADNRFIWVFPLRRKVNAVAPKADATPMPDARSMHYLPYGTYAAIAADLNDEQVKLVHDALDHLKEAGIGVTDQRDVDLMRYHNSLEGWHQAVLNRVRSTIRELIAKRKRYAKGANRQFELVDDELKINAASTEQELRDALSFLDRDDVASVNKVFDEAMRSVPMPEVPKSLQNLTETEPMRVADIESAGAKRVDPARFRNFT
jgi:hypothetical protein